MFYELEITSHGAALFMLGFIIITISLIVFLRIKFRNYTLSYHKKSTKPNSSNSLSNRTKFTEIDIFKLSASFFNYGLAAAVALSLVAISWTTYEKQFKMEIEDLVNVDELEIETPRIPEPPAQPPLPPPPFIQEVPDAEILDNSPEFVDNSIEVDTKVETHGIIEKKAVQLLPAPLPPINEEVEYVKIADQMPRFPGCEDKAMEEEKKKCSEIALMTYIYRNLKYPTLAKEVGVEGPVVIQFVVDKEGNITNVNIVRDIGAGCGEAAANVIYSMNNMKYKWVAGKQRGRPVNVLYTLPVKFKLDR